MVWCEVFGGGIGGIVARARPNIDPTPTGARGQIKAWCAAHDVPWELGAGANYEALSEDDPPLVADDADVSVIAAHAARIALDLLVRKDSAFPASAYAIGLRSGWIFEAPFDTWPIVLAGEGEWKAPHSSDNHAELMALVAELFPRASVA